MTEHWMLKAFELALAVCVGSMAWFRRDTDEEDEVVSKAHELVLDSISDADLVTRIDTVTGKNVRDQLTVEEAIEIEEESRLRRFGWGRN